ncbi:hypothetical protein CI610_02499 [invertebrate metagenome]|uniref:Uncharacterized protein n=1 Tax=invertebrate metagenome TaxID=1711999 RepID=A0A2H9T5T9_9ZZZZ
MRFTDREQDTIKQTIQCYDPLARVLIFVSCAVPQKVIN